MLNTIDTRKMNPYEKCEYFEKIKDSFSEQVVMLRIFIDNVESILDWYEAYTERYGYLSVDELIQEFLESNDYYKLDEDFTKQEFIDVAHAYGYKHKQIRYEGKRFYTLLKGE